jgi:hypothetical protein
MYRTRQKSAFRGTESTGLPVEPFESFGRTCYRLKKRHPGTPFPIAILTLLPLLTVLISVWMCQKGASDLGSLPVARHLDHVAELS